MDEFTKKHLDKWVENTLPEEIQEVTKTLMLNVVEEDPELIDYGWPKVYKIIENQIPQDLINNI